MFEPQQLRETVDLGFDEANAGSAAADAEDRQAARLRGVEHRVRMIVVDIDDGGGTAVQQRLEQPQLGGEIRFEALMIIEMIAGDVGEAARRDAQAVEPELIEAVRRRFDGKMGDAVAGERIDRTMQFDRIRRGQRAVSLAAW